MKKIEALMEDAVKSGIFPGGSIAIGDKNGLQYKKTVGLRQLEPRVRPLKEDTMFDLASLTKVVGTTMVALKLLEENKLLLTSTLGEFFKCSGAMAKITVKELLTHTSGLPPHANLFKMTGEVYGNILAQHLGPKEVDYSCLGFILLGKICGLAGTSPLDTLVEKYVTTPLGLNNTCYNPQGLNFAVTEFDEELGQWLTGVVHDENARYMGGVSGNAGLFANLADCAQFAQMLLGQGAPIIGADMFKMATSNLTHPGQYEGRGLGFAIKGQAFGHTGFTGTSIWVGNGLYVVLLTNRVHPTRENTAIAEFRQVLHSSILGVY